MKTTIFQIVGAEDGNPVVFATVILSNANLGVISDENGNFRVPAKYLTEDESLKISSIGYQTEEFKVDLILSRNQFILKLNQKAEPLDEVVLKAKAKEKQYGARKLVKLAIKNITDNYPLEPFAYISYYRDYQKVVDAREMPKNHSLRTADYVNLNEGIVKIFDAGFDTNKFYDSKNQAALIQYDVNKDFLIDSLLAVPYDNVKVKYLKGVVVSPLGGNELNLLYIGNCIRNNNYNSFSFVDVMNKDFVQHHSFWIDKIVYLDEEPLYKIDFLSSIMSMNPYYKGSGSIYIGKNDFGIHKLSYTNKDVKKNAVLYEVNVEYKKYEDRYFLNYLTFNNYFNIRYGDVFKVESILYHYDSSSFHVFFNHDIDPESIDVSGNTIAFYYRQKKLSIKEMSLIDPKTLSVKLLPFKKEVTRNDIENDISYTIHEVRDKFGIHINEGPVVTLKQFREIFVQEVFEQKEMDSTFYFIDKNKVLSASKTNENKESQKYWVNSPLKESK
ncbi:carboxypeptidase-like regulatory domain-containing protein [Lutimonas sp.]|uniref:carboxypeptidase-like regulatory domain-containing protein n=1 Tax=Lutimonas sp. TaxID=1872403 RepID=UPI003D9AC758